MERSSKLFFSTSLAAWVFFLAFSFGVTWYLISAINAFAQDQNVYLTTSTQTMQLDQNDNTGGTVSDVAVISTNFGDIKIQLDPADAPNTVANFEKLAKSGFYDGTRFHRVIKNFMIQGGDPLSKDTANMQMWGTGGPEYQFNDEINVNSPLYKTGYARGVVAMANSGKNTNGSQFFIMHQNVPLDPNYTIFGKVISGMDVVDKIANLQTTGSPYDRPLSDALIQKVTIE